MDNITIISHSIPRYILCRPRTPIASLKPHNKAQINKPWDSEAANVVAAIDEDNRIEDIKFVQNVSGMAHVPVAEYSIAGLGEFEIEFKLICSIEYSGYRPNRRHYVLLVGSWYYEDNYETEVCGRWIWSRSMVTAIELNASGLW